MSTSTNLVAIGASVRSCRRQCAFTHLRALLRPGSRADTPEDVGDEIPSVTLSEEQELGRAAVLQDLHRRLIEGRAGAPRAGSVVELESIPLYAVPDGNGSVVAPVVPYLRDLTLDDSRPLTVRSYAYDLQRWFRLLWFLGVPWDRATEAEATALVGWLRVAPNPQRRR